MPEFGYHPTGTTKPRRTDKGRLTGTVFTCPEFGIGESITAMVAVTLPGDCGHPKNFSCAIYDASVEYNLPLVGYTSEVLVDSTMNFSWVEFPFEPGHEPSLIASNPYLLVCWAEEGIGCPEQVPPVPPDDDRGFIAVETGMIGLDIYRMVKTPYYNWPYFYEPFSTITDPLYSNTAALIFCTYSTDAPDCTDPYGWIGNAPECGNGGTNQPDTTHRYECTGGSETGGWDDNGYDSLCDMQQPCSYYHEELPCTLNDCFWCNEVCQPIECEVICSDYNDDPVACEQNNCFYYNGACHGAQPSCGMINNPSDCSAYYCYWCDGACQSTPCGGGEIPWTTIAIVGAAGVSVAAVGLALLLRKK